MCGIIRHVFEEANLLGIKINFGDFFIKKEHLLYLGKIIIHSSKYCWPLLFHIFWARGRENDSSFGAIH